MKLMVILLLLIPLAMIVQGLVQLALLRWFR